MKKLIALTLAMLMVLSLCACSSGSKTEEAPAEEPSTAPAEELPTEAPAEEEPTEAPAEEEPTEAPAEEEPTEAPAEEEPTEAPAEEEPTEAPAEEEPTEAPAEDAAAGAPETIEEGKLIMSTNAAFPPYEMTSDGEGAYTGEDGVSLEGIDVEIAVALAEKVGLELVIEDMDFDSALLAVQEGKADMMLAGLTYNEERDEVMDFSTSYSTGVQVVIVPEGSDIASPDDLEGKLIGTQRGTTGQQYCEGDYGEENVKAYDNGMLAVQALQNGQVDAVVIDNAPAQAFVDANEGLTILDTEYITEDYCLAVDEGNTQLLDVLNSALEEMIDDGTVQSILDKYITAE